jgi:hypothetical protein|tara:strand:- start:681 stop:917 length:237 start_codon:yes stop_codon:yes gene_type:complete
MTLWRRRSVALALPLHQTPVSYLSTQAGFALFFPLNIVLLPLTTVEWRSTVITPPYNHRHAATTLPPHRRNTAATPPP